jgi:hypothetical protein
VRVVDPEGKPVSMSAITSKAADAAFDVSRLVPRTDSFTVFVQGNPFGYDRETIAKTATGFTVRGETKLGPMLSYTTEMVLGPSGEMIASRQDGAVQGMPVKANFDYAAGRVKGTATTPTPQGPKSVTVDTTVPPGTVDERALTTMLTTLPWAAGAKFAFPVFYSTENSLKQTQLSVAATESVTVPAGTFQAYKVDMSGGRVPTTFWIEVAAPHRVLKMAPVGQPVELQLAK